MSDDHHRSVVPGQTLHNLQDLADHLRIQSRGRFVKEQNIRIHSHSPGDGHPLLLPAGKPVGIFQGFIDESHLIEQFSRLFLCLLLPQLFELHRRQRDIPQHRHVGKQIELLKHHPDLLAEFVNLFKVVHNGNALNDDISFCGHFQQINAAEKGGFTAAGGTDNADTLALFDAGIYPLEYLQLAEIFMQILNINHCAASTFPGNSQGMSLS